MSTPHEKLRFKISIIQQMLMVLQKMLNLTKGSSIKGIIVHHTATNSRTTSVEAINKGHKARRFYLSARGSYVGYHYVIDSTGKITQTRDDDEEGCHTRGYNKNYIGIGLFGNFDEERLTQAQKDSLSGLIEKLRGRYGISYANIKGHSDIKPTACPGNYLYSWLKEFKKI